MDYVMVTFTAGQAPGKDLKVPAFVPIGELIEMLAEALHLAVEPENRIQAEPVGRILDNRLTLEQEGVADGALLTLI
ncbi:EsaB/YukD family protein [Paenibacillus sp. CAA11]|uniref:EsaB/YukD family protein n=1 Tax=Paenibacillus sp. CAA11 TaxID=1532905 RepID=UPI00131F087A|nr:EsaB/YukD family protein [Paenibacillus sp. CAA11]